MILQYLLKVQLLDENKQQERGLLLGLHLVSSHEGMV